MCDCQVNDMIRIFFSPSELHGIAMSKKHIGVCIAEILKDKASCLNHNYLVWKLLPTDHAGVN